MVGIFGKLLVLLLLLCLGGRSAATELELAVKDQVALGSWFCMLQAGPADLGVEHQLRMARWGMYVTEQNITIVEARTLPDTPFARRLQNAISGTEEGQQDFCKMVHELTAQVAPQLLGLPRKQPYAGEKPAMPPLVDILLKVRICHDFRIFDRMSVYQTEVAVRLAAELNDLNEDELNEIIHLSAANVDTFRTLIVDQKTAETECSAVQRAAKLIMNFDLQPPARIPG